MRNNAIIVAAGKGTRMGPGMDKLFLEVSGRPLIAHTWQRFEDAVCINEIILVIREGLEKDFQELAARFHFRKPFRLVSGGKERQDSVWNGLLSVSDDCELVAIHDGARPCTPVSLIEQTLLAAQEDGAAVAAQRVTDTIKESSDGRIISAHLDRELLWAVQTPQTFRVEIIRRALMAVRDRGLVVTDDTAACQLIGQPVRLVPCPGPNPKVTVPADLAYIGLLLNEDLGNAG